MNDLMPLGAQPLTMTSLEIAALVNSRHDKVKKSIERLAERGTISLPPMGEVSNDGPGPKTISVYFVGKRDSYVIVAQLSPEFTARLVDRWQDLEAKTAITLPNFGDPAAAARAWAVEFEAKQEAQAQLAAAAPKVEFADALLNADGTALVRDVAKTIGVRVRLLEKALKLKRVILSNNAPAAIYVAKGYFKEEIHPYETKTRGTQIGHVARVTGKGIEFLRRFVARHSDLVGAAK